MIRIDRNSPLPFYRQIHHAVVDGIRSGAYRKGDRLPSIRSLADDLGVSRNTVEQAYMLLVQEDYAQPMRGSGYYVSCASAPLSRPVSFDGNYQQTLQQLQANSPTGIRRFRYDFRPGATDPQDFPFYRWACLSRDVMLDPGRERACLPGDPRGSHELRKQLARSLERDSDIVVQAEQLAVFPSVPAAIASLLSLFDRHTDVFRMTNPGNPQVAAAARNAGFSILPLSMCPRFCEADLQASIKAMGRSIAYCNPRSMFPLNREMPETDRTTLLEWASQTGSYLLEDERGRELTQAGQGLPSLHALDTHGRVISIGSFDQSLSPTSCLAYVALPPQLMLRWLQEGPAPLQVPWQTQETLAQMMVRDLWNGHLRRLQAANRAKGDALAAAIEKHLGKAVECVHPVASRHVLVRMADGRDADLLVRQAAEGDVGVQPTGPYWLEMPPPNWEYLMLDFAAVPAEDLEPGIHALAQAWKR